MRKKRRFLRSFNHAANGLILCFRSERNMRIHFILAACVMVAALFFEFSKVELILLLLAVMFVLFAEMINTALEYVIDASCAEYHPLVRVAKDVSAGAVLLSACFAVITGYLLFYDRLVPIGNRFLGGIHQNPIHLTFLSLGLTTLLVISLKSKYSQKRGSYFQGGKISGHAAISFLLATIVAFSTRELVVACIAFILAFLVAESRVEGKIHTARDTFNGSLLGIIVGSVVFLLFG